MSKEQDPKRRVKFYTSKEVTSHLFMNGVPNTKRSWQALIALAATGTKGEVAQELADYLRDVRFEVHPQQINVRDTAHGKMVASIRR